MMTNVGVLDGVFRFALALALLAWSDGVFGSPPDAIWIWPFWIAAMTIGLTGLFRYSPLYALLGTNSCAIYPGPDRR